jgi:glycosyltransferase involved in cell wall biosynthesis
MKNESFMIEEWIDHYLSQGADRIYLIDNGSTDDTLEKVRPMVADGRAELVVYLDQHKQVEHYWSAYKHFSMESQCEWIAIVDIDEFWFCKSGEKLASYVARQEQSDAIYTNWTIFGTDLEEQPVSVRQSLVTKQPRLDKQTKYIFRTSVALQPHDLSVHYVRDIGLNRAKIDNTVLQLNHYVTKSREFWKTVKLKRGEVAYVDLDLPKIQARFDTVNAACTATCTKLRDFVQAGVWKT